MSERQEAWKTVLNGAAQQDELALLKLARRVTRLLETYGAYTVRKDWSAEARQIALDIVAGWTAPGGGKSGPEAYIESVSKNKFWGVILDLMGQNHLKASQLFFPTVRRLLGKWDGSRRIEAQWDDVVQETAQQLWEQWHRGGVERPWALLCTIAKRRYLDRVRAEKPTDQIDDEMEMGEEPGEESGGIFTQQALAILEKDEREIIVRMDLEGRTRVEIAGDLGVTEGQVLSVRRAGLRRIWRWLGRDLPPDSRAVWEEMFKGARRIPPGEVASKLGLDPSAVVEMLEEARVLTGLG